MKITQIVLTALMAAGGGGTAAAEKSALLRQGAAEKQLLNANLGQLVEGGAQNRLTSIETRVLALKEEILSAIKNQGVSGAG